MIFLINLICGNSKLKERCIDNDLVLSVSYLFIYLFCVSAVLIIHQSHYLIIITRFWSAPRSAGFFFDKFINLSVCSLIFLCMCVRLSFRFQIVFVLFLFSYGFMVFGFFSSRNIWSVWLFMKLNLVLVWLFLFSIWFW